MKCDVTTNVAPSPTTTAVYVAGAATDGDGRFSIKWVNVWLPAGHVLRIHKTWQIVSLTMQVIDLDEMSTREP